MELRSIITRELSEARDVLDNFLKDPAQLSLIEKAAVLIADRINDGGKIFSCGNGGSMCDAMHFAEELTGRFRDDRRPLPAISISDPSHISCVSNDYGYEQVFSRYLAALGKRGDVLLAISTSGNSPNIIAAVRQANELGMDVVVLTGKGGGSLKNMGGIIIDVPHVGYADRIQEVHIKVIHILIQLIEKLT
ncbi:D-sedoheptulose 7-phosphate isomerase [Fulvivirga sedimenti]|uniref:Phosphoheptose isomerase n=1 Tax=Fulvivirga sedimenti TaxID=2879465 RepID=A0A9X1HU80_9BACT|nr:D-sedoheptulose 7-phosphate isomerase [Fulvivirga sedimenti]MCA6078015.1 D-sedoheptulose 7-phosphate isomerase [Fulvivirga sedimenti]